MKPKITREKYPMVFYCLSQGAIVVDDRAAEDGQHLLPGFVDDQRQTGKTAEVLRDGRKTATATTAR